MTTTICPCCEGPFQLCDGCAEATLDDGADSCEDDCCLQRLRGDSVAAAVAKVAADADALKDAADALQSALGALGAAVNAQPNSRDQRVRSLAELVWADLHPVDGRVSWLDKKLAEHGWAQ